MVQIWLGLCQIHSPAEFEFLPVYFPNEEEKKNPELFAENVRREMAKCLKCPLSDYSYEDAIFMNKAKQLGLPLETGLIKIENYKKNFGYNRI